MEKNKSHHESPYIRNITFRINIVCDKILGFRGLYRFCDISKLACVRYIVIICLRETRK